MTSIPRIRLNLQSFSFQPLNRRISYSSRASGHLRTARSPSSTSRELRSIHTFSTIMAGTRSRAIKRAQETTSTNERPTKLQKTTNGQINGDNVPIDSSEDYEEDIDQTVIPILAAPMDTPEWQKAIEKVVSNVVSIRFSQTCAFDTDPALTSEATGFVVDADQGLVLTNRHVVGAGPFWGYLIFDNHEEVDVRPVYRDPVHDFGILKFDPKAIKYQKLTALQLRPDLAKVGVEIRVIGNDAGEKLSILSGVISRLDRNAPEYGEGYSDFNTNYIQAAAAASGGSSGSPVVNSNGEAVALQAGGRSDGAATDYFLPLDRPKRALELIQKGLPVTRGTIQCQWMLKPFDECRRLGLSEATETLIRTMFPKETGMLVAEIILPEGPAHKHVEEGDILVKVNGENLTRFVDLDAILDSHVGQAIKLTLQRGGTDLEITVTVGDLHKITPDRFVSVAGASFHDLSYQQARLYAVACRGVFVCEATNSFRFDGMDNGWIIQKINGMATPDLDTFIQVVKDIPDREKVVVRYYHLRDLHTENTSIVQIDRHWSSKMRLATRNDTTGLWDFEDLADALPARAPERASGTFVTLEHASPPAAAEVLKSFVRISCLLPMKLDGFPRARKWGMGLVVDAGKGLVIVSRAIVPYDLCDITITIADSVFLEAKVVFLHPLQNYAIIKYDPELIDADVRSARLSHEPITKGESTYFLGYNQNMRFVAAKTTVTDVAAVAIPTNISSPRYRAVNLDAITVDTNLSSQCGSGVLVKEDGTVQALWMTYLGERSPSSHKDTEYHLGLGTSTLRRVLEQIQNDIVPKLRMLSVEFSTLQISQARIMGVPEDWVKKVIAANTTHHQIFMVRKRAFDLGKDNANALVVGDILLSLNGKVITRVGELDIMYENETLEAVIVRDGEVKTITLSTVAADDLETNRAISFCGAVVQRPHLAVRQQIRKLHSEVYVSARTRGSPSYQYGLAPTSFITAVNDVSTMDMDSFLREIVKIPDNTYFRLRCMSSDDVPWVVTIKRNDHYFPTVDWIKDSEGSVTKSTNGWRRKSYEYGTVVDGEGEEGIRNGGQDVDFMDADDVNMEPDSISL